MRIRVSWFFLIATVVFYLFSKSAWEANYSGVAESFFVIGLLLASVGAMGRLWCSAYIAGYKTESLVTDGPYSICRNPLYFFSFVGCLGVALATEMATFPIIVAAGFACYYPFVIVKEEAKLAKLHGQAFTDYMQQVPRFFPSLRLLVEKEVATVHLVIFRKHIQSAIWFVWIPAFLECVEYLHEAHFLPTYISLY